MEKAIIIGSGPAGYTAGIYLGRSLIEHTIITGLEPGGQLTITTTVENYPGFIEPINGPKLMEQMAEQAKVYGSKIINDHIVNFEPLPNYSFELTGASGQKYHSKAVIVATGSSAKWLGLPSEQEYKGFGVSACATCDGFFFKGQDVIVIGGANTAVEEAIFLANLCQSVTIVYRGQKLRAEPILKERLNNFNNVKVLFNKELKELLGKDNPKQLTGAIIVDNQTGDTQKINCSGCFIAIGHTPNTKIFANKLELDKKGYIAVKYPFSPETSQKGVFAAGDVQDSKYRQAITAAGSGCMAAIETINYLNNAK